MHEKIDHIDPKKGHPGLSILSILFDAKIKPQFTTLLLPIFPRGFSKDFWTFAVILRQKKTMTKNFDMALGANLRS